MATMVSPIVTIARPRSVSDYRAGRGANQPARKRSAARVASQAADKRAGTATDQCAAQYTIIVPPIRTPSERQCHCNHDQCLAHPLPLSNWYSPPKRDQVISSPSARGFVVRACLDQENIPISKVRIA
jgi:hypothetical protein